MFRLSKKSEYALLALRCLEQSGDRTATVREIAAACSLPPPLLAKLMQQLARGGVVTSLQGVNGGYLLARSMAGISLAEVIEVVDGPLRLTACGGGGRRCDRSPSCELKGMLTPVQSQLYDYLRSVSLADLETGLDK